MSKRILLSIIVSIALFPLYSTFSQEIRSTETPMISGGAEGSAIYQTLKNRGELPNIIPGPNSYLEGTDAPGSFIQACDFDTNATYNGSYFIPPDNHAAAGSTYVVNVVNCLIQVFTKSGTLQYTDDIQGFCQTNGFTPNTATFDPKILYDQFSDRWVFVTLERTDVSFGDPANTSLVIMGCSQTSNPLGSWYIDTINTKINIGGTDTWLDYPGFAVDEEAIYVTGNMFAFAASGGSYQGQRTIIMDKSTFYSTGNLSYTVHDPHSLTGYNTTLMPAHIYGTAPTNVGTFLVGYSGLSNGTDEFIVVYRVDNPLTTPSWNSQVINIGNIENTGTGMPNAPQPGTSTLIETNDRRALDAVWQNNGLYLVMTIVNSSTEATAYWVELNTSTLSAITSSDGGQIDAEDIATGTHTYFPSIAIDPNDNLGFGFSASSSSTYGGAYFTYRLSGDAAGTVRTSQTVKTGTDYYIRTFGGSRNRWGDYSGTAVDPVDGKMWVYNQYAMTRGTSFGGEDGRWSTGYRYYYIDAPNTPTLSSPANGATGITVPTTLTWNAAFGATSYSVEVATDNGFTNIVNSQSGLTATTTSVAGLLSGTQYYWRVRAVNPEDSTNSAAWNFTTQGSAPPAPVLVSPVNGATNQPTSLTFTWNPSAGATGYQIDIATDAGFTNIVYTQSGITGTSHPVTGLANGTLHHWRVTASNTSGSNTSAAWTFTTIVAAPPAPALVSPANGATGQTLPVTCTWNASAGATSYSIDVATDAGFTNIVFTQSGITGTSQQVTGLANNTLYHWRVTATNVGGSNTSTAWTFTTIVAAPPAPALVSPANGATGQTLPVTCTWNASAGATSYSIDVATDAGFTNIVFTQSGITGTSQQVTGLANNTLYHWRVTATNSGGSNTSAAWTFTTVVAAPPAPALVSPTNGATNQTLPVTCTWNASAGATSYSIDVATDAGFTNIVFTQSGIAGTSQQVTGLANGTLYHWRVTATNAGGSNTSTAWTFTTIVALPAIPTLVSPVDASTGIPVNPTLVWNTASGAANYRLQVATDTNFTAIVYEDSTLTGTSQSVGPLQYNTKYFWRVEALNVAGNSGYSAIWRFTTVYEPVPAATNLAASTLPNQPKTVYLSWTDNATNEAGFYIERKDGDSTSSSTYAVIDTLPSNSVAYTDTNGLQDTTWYTYRLQACSSDTVAPYSNQAEVQTLIPVELTSFTASTGGTGIIVNWETASELNNKGFEVERMLPGHSEFGSWTVVGFVQGMGTITEKTVYSFKDEIKYLSYKGDAHYRLKQIDNNGTFTYSDPVIIEVDFTPKEYTLYQNYPNPFNPATTIKFAIPEKTEVVVTVYNQLGEKLAILFDGVLEEGFHELTWNAGNMPSGVYIYELSSKSFTSAKKMLLMK